MKDIARPDIKPAFAERNIPVVFATDENYLPYVKVAVSSAVANAAGSNLDILILHSGMSDESIQALISRYARIESVSVRFVDISGELEASGISDYKQTGRLPMSSCYRLLLPRTLPEYGKIVYIDVDVVVCRDLGELYSTDIGNNWFAAAKDVVYITKPEYVSWASKWGFTEWDGYVNAGVMVRQTSSNPGSEGVTIRIRGGPLPDPGALMRRQYFLSGWLCGSCKRGNFP